MESALVRGEKSTDVEPSRNVFVCAIVPTCIEILDGWISSARGATSDLPALEGGAKMSGGLQIQPDDELKFRRAFAAPACASPALPPRPFRSKKHAMLTPFPLPIFPSPLDGAVELKKQIPATIRLYNSGNEEIAFKVKTTAPKKYCVKPNTGFVKKGETVNVHVIMQAQREWPADMMKCKDKFLVQSCPSGGSTEFTELFVKGKEDIKEQKLKVSYSQPAPPPSPVPEGEEGPSEDATKAKSMFTAAETAPVSNDVGSLQRELERFRAKNESLSKDLDMALQGGKRERSTGFTLFHLLLVAIVAFLVGHYS